MTLVESFPSIKQFAESADMNDSHVSQIKAKSSHIGDRLARKIETSFKKPHGWLDATHQDSAGEKRAIYLADSNDDPYKSSINEEAVTRATEFLMDEIGLEGMKEMGTKWCAKTIIMLYELFSDPGSEQLNHSTIMKMVKNQR